MKNWNAQHKRPALECPDKTEIYLIITIYLLYAYREKRENARPAMPHFFLDVLRAFLWCQKPVWCCWHQNEGCTGSVQDDGTLGQDGNYKYIYYTSTLSATSGERE